MAYLAASTNAGTRKQVNEDACCVQVAQTSLGEVLMAVVCDGVGGLAKGNVASSTVIDRFASWFQRELPALMEGMAAAGRFDFGVVRMVWGALLQAQNELIRTHGVQVGARLGTTFTGIIACKGHYLIGHVGDCRAYRMDKASFEQLTQDQTLVAKRLAAGEITPEEAARAPKNVILQAVGSQRTLDPVFSEGSFGSQDLFVICCDGAYHKAENEGIRRLFQGLDYRDEAALQQACDTLLQFDMDCGEKDNLTVACFSGALDEPEMQREDASLMAGPSGLQPVEKGAKGSYAPAAHDDTEDGLPTMVEPDSDDDQVTDEDGLATMVAVDEAASDEDELPTMVGMDADEDEPAAMAVPESPDEDDLPTMVEPDSSDDRATDDSAEDDLATMVADDEPEDDLAPGQPALSPAELSKLLRELSARLSTADEDGLATVVVDDIGDDLDEDDDDDFGLPSFDEDDLPTEVADDEPVWASDPDDDLPTMVDGGDA